MTYIIESLTKEFVTFKVIGNGEKGIRTFCNSNYDRNELLETIPISLYEKVMNTWGETATIADLPDPRK